MRLIKNEEKTMHTYKNSFHGTEVRSRKSPEELDAIRIRLCAGKATAADRAFERRMRKALCGIADCQCGDDFGIRG